MACGKVPLDVLLEIFVRKAVGKDFRLSGIKYMERLS